MCSNEQAKYNRADPNIRNNKINPKSLLLWLLGIAIRFRSRGIVAGVCDSQRIHMFKVHSNMRKRPKDYGEGAVEDDVRRKSFEYFKHLSNWCGSVLELGDIAYGRKWIGILK